MGTVLALFTFFVGATAIEAADFGAPAWFFVPLLLWLVTIGLPSTVAVLLLAAVWGTTAPLYGFFPFCIIAMLVAVSLQVWSIKAVTHLIGGSYAI